MNWDIWLNLSTSQFLHLKNGRYNNSYLTGLLEELKLNKIVYSKPFALCLVHSTHSVKEIFITLLASSPQIKGTWLVTSQKRGRNSAETRTWPQRPSWPSSFLLDGESGAHPPHKGFGNKHSMLFHMPVLSHSEYSPSDEIPSMFILLQGQRTLIKVSKLKTVRKAKKEVRKGKQHPLIQ